MDSKTVEKIEALREKIKELDREKSLCEVKMWELYESGTNLRDKYIEFYDGECFHYMKVEMTQFQTDKLAVGLLGPCITLSDSPLSPLMDNGEPVDMGRYEEDGHIILDANTLQATSVKEYRYG